MANMYKEPRHSQVTGKIKEAERRRANRFVRKFRSPRKYGRSIPQG